MQHILALFLADVQRASAVFRESSIFCPEVLNPNFLIQKFQININR
jgi:hypothetical protein